MTSTQQTVGILTLGCKVNQYESEAIAERFAALGFLVLPPSRVCDIYVINTCTVTAESARKSRQFIRRAIAKNPEALILVTGCLAQTEPESLAAIDGVDYIFGNDKKLSVAEAALAPRRAVQGAANICVNDIAKAPFEPMTIEKFDRTRAYIKIQDGCESHCTYCIIPSARGRLRSKPIDAVIAEVSALTVRGCGEVVLTGIETASFGRDLGSSLIELLEAVDAIPGIGRVRLGSLDPALIRPDFVERLARLGALAPHLHLSMQSGSNTILGLMKRKYNTKMALQGMSLLREALPNIQFTADMILGFPGEGQAEFEETLAFIEQARFLMIHAFPYSARKGTPAALMPHQVPEAVRHERVGILADRQTKITTDLLTEATAKRPIVSVLFETHRNSMAMGHTDNFLEIAVPSPRPLNSITAAVALDKVSDGRIYGHLI